MKQTLAFMAVILSSSSATAACVFDKKIDPIVRQVEETTGLKVSCNTRFVFSKQWLQCPGAGKCDTYIEGTFKEPIVHVYVRNFIAGTELASNDNLNCTVLAHSLVNIAAQDPYQPHDTEDKNNVSEWINQVYMKLGCK